MSAAFDQIADVLGREFGRERSSITEGTRLNELRFDSLDWPDFWCGIEDRCAIEIDENDPDIQNAGTLGELAAAVEKDQGAEAAVIDLNELSYLATPYTKYYAGLDGAFKDASALAARLLRQGWKIYSPIAHTHPIAIYGGLDPKDHSIWLPFDEAMMRACSTLIVAQLEGWQESYGVKHEIDFFTKAGKPVFYLDKVTLRVAAEPWEFA